MIKRAYRGFPQKFLSLQTYILDSKPWVRSMGLFFLSLFVVTCGAPRCTDKIAPPAIPSPSTGVSPPKLDSGDVLNPDSGSQIQYVSQLETLNSAILLIYNKYVDQTRIDPKRMVLSALHGIEEQVAEVQVSSDPKSNRVVVRVDTASREYTIPPDPSPFWIATILTDVFNFTIANLSTRPDQTGLQKIEYAAINGMLSTLDPHSLLLDQQITSELKSGTRGHFDGVGMIVGMYKGQLTVIKPLQDTPAKRAGVRKGDRILRIGNQSTINMALTDAVARLRGLAGTHIEIWVIHRGESETHKLVLNRQEIPVHSVTSHLLWSLGKPIGYVRISQFSQTTAEDLRKSFAQLNYHQKIAGLVLDLRNNPGGLLDQATKVADEFLNSGTIVSTIGSHESDVIRADRAMMEPVVPMVVLVDGQSASASEIVAGALKKLGRAVVMGHRTFGKGSVQNLIDLRDGSSLKLTVGQYLTPGDQSIQSVGIVPDVALEPMLIKKNRLALFHTFQGTREQDLNEHLISENTRNDKSAVTLRYLFPLPKNYKEENTDDEISEEAALEDALESDDSDFDSKSFAEKQDREIDFAKELLASAGNIGSGEMLNLPSAKAFFVRKQNDEQNKVIDMLGKLGIDWKPIPPSALTPLLSTVITTDRKDNKVTAGDTLTISIVVTNNGKGPAGQVRAQLKSENLLFEEQEFIFGHLEPGQSKIWQTPIKIPISEQSRLDQVKINFFEQYGHIPASQTMQIEMQELPRPRFAYRYQLIDSGEKANGDGLLQKGESVRLHVVVKNVGGGTALKPIALLRSLSEDNVLVNQGRFELPALKPNEQNDTIDFTFDVLPDFEGPNAKFELVVYDSKLAEVVTDKLTFPISTTTLSGQNSNGDVTLLHQDTEIHAGAGVETPVIAYAKKDASFTVEKIFDETGFIRIHLGSDLPGFIEKKAGDMTKKKVDAQFSWAWQVTPPHLDVSHPPLLTHDETFLLDTLAKDDDQIKDAFVFVQTPIAKNDERKVFYQSNRLGKDKKQMSIRTQIPLSPGLNVVTLIVRQSEEVQSRETWIINRQVEHLVETEPKKVP